MARFYNPYHFVPVSAPNKEQAHASAPRAVFDRNLRQPTQFQQVTHERYAPDTRSGRLVVRLTTVTPTVIGAKQENDPRTGQPRVHPFRVEGRAAIPASTLRGLIGSVIEAASNGPLRVLDDRVYSYRKKMEGESLSAIGLLVKDGDALKLRPMCLPTLESNDGGETFELPRKSAGFRKLFVKPQFKVYVDASGNTGKVQRKRVKQLEWSGNKVIRDNSLHIKKDRGQRDRYAVSQVATDGVNERFGLLRVLGRGGDRERRMPKTKKHELWLPLPNAKAAPLPIPQEVFDRFHQLADERFDWDETLPFEPVGSRSGPKDRGEGAKLRLRDGDMVYFDVDEKGVVTEVSLSAIWRGRVENKLTHAAATAHRFFDPQQTPLHPGRDKISIAEQILGFVDEIGDDKTKAALSFASRVRFGDAFLRDGVEGLFDPPVTLKIMDSPKLPCPSLYFKGRDGKGKYIKKPELDPGLHAAQGRKWYLHARPDPKARPWVTNKPADGVKQKARVEPLRAGQSFFLHIDFDNLSDVEFGLLLHALEPDAGFHHKLGLGKPLGLGSVKIETMGYLPVDRTRRYSLAGLRAARTERVEVTAAGKAALERSEWPSRYKVGADAVVGGADAIINALEIARSSGLISPSAQKALSLLGDYAGAPAAAAVHYPTNAEQRDKEAEHFEWFVFNDGQRAQKRAMTPSGQYLKPLEFEKALPELTELEWGS